MVRQPGPRLPVAGQLTRARFPRNGGYRMNLDDFPAPKEGFVITHGLVVADLERSREFYRSLLGGQVLRAGAPVIMKVGNTALPLTTAGGPIDDHTRVSPRAPTE